MTVGGNYKAKRGSNLLFSKKSRFDPLLPGFGQARQLAVPKAPDQVVVDHAGRLHVRVDDRRADELESPRLKVLADGVRQGRLGRHLGERPQACEHRLAPDEPPDVAVEGSELLPDLEKTLGVIDRP